MKKFAIFSMLILGLCFLAPKASAQTAESEPVNQIVFKEPTLLNSNQYNRTIVSLIYNFPNYAPTSTIYCDFSLYKIDGSLIEQQTYNVSDTLIWFAPFEFYGQSRENIVGKRLYSRADCFYISEGAKKYFTSATKSFEFPKTVSTGVIAPLYTFINQNTGSPKQLSMRFSLIDTSMQQYCLYKLPGESKVWNMIPFYVNTPDAFQEFHIDNIAYPGFSITNPTYSISVKCRNDYEPSTFDKFFSIDLSVSGYNGIN